MKTADAWAIEAAGFPVAFSQVREDSRLDRDIVRGLGAGATVMMIASGGETAVCLSRLPLERLILVDMNPAQLAMTRCRFHLAENFSAEENFALLGHTAMPTELRKMAWVNVFRHLCMPDDILGCLDRIARRGADHCGRYEAVFTEIRRALHPVSSVIQEFLASAQPVSPPAEIRSAFASVLRWENLVALFGEGATQNPRRPFHEHFSEQLCDISQRMPPADNPWVWQLLAGEFPRSGPYDWFHEARTSAVIPEYMHASMVDAMKSMPEGSIDFLHLSNILDWLSPEEACATLDAAYRVLRVGGRMLIRQLNSTLEIPSLVSGFFWDKAEGRRLQRADRSFFYPEIHLALKS